MDLLSIKYYNDLLRDKATPEEIMAHKKKPHMKEKHKHEEKHEKHEKHDKHHDKKDMHMKDMKKGCK